MDGTLGVGVGVSEGVPHMSLDACTYTHMCACVTLYTCIETSDGRPHGAIIFIVFIMFNMYVHVCMHMYAWGSPTYPHIHTPIYPPHPTPSG